MELRHLRYFVAVAEEGHFTRAAERLHMQQPPLSQQIRALEEELGFALFDRHPKGARLTAGGAAFLVEARSILASVSAGAARASLAAHGATGLLKIGFTSSAAAHELTPRIIRSYRAEWPSVMLEFSEENASELTQMLEDGAIDVAFLRQPVRRPLRLRFQTIDSEEMVLVLPSGHACLRGQRGSGLPTVSLASLRDERFVMLRHSGALGMYASLVAACERVGYMPQVAIEVERMLTMISLVAAGAGVSAVPASMRGFHEKNVVYCQIAERDETLMAPLTFVCRDDDQQPTLMNFRKMVDTFVERSTS
ncbi:LysR family transcriptional regulator [Massilia arenosa]|uniref:LysR family transcriptional regulator n=1 Tax=Zemynaea arenosa TaxID=2561931 RepID=A0A4Y9SDI3_9BURK|nr:LysR family transcriptional regulator [Massilia arenosa]TFW20814.1 LysR family transcriptional regulator [Massilia arenosa]